MLRRCSDRQGPCLPSSRLNLEEGIKVEMWPSNTVGWDKDYHRWPVYCYGGSRKGTGIYLLWAYGYQRGSRAALWVEWWGIMVKDLVLPKLKSQVWDSVIISCLIGSASFPGSSLVSGWPEEHRVILGYSCCNWLLSLYSYTCNRLQTWPQFFVAPPIRKQSPFPYPLRLGWPVICFD